MTTRRTTIAGVLAGGAVLAAGGLGPVTAAPTPPLAIPDHATLTITGHGFGHGHGLSQYGAEGAARKGLSAQQIVRFYYPHTAAGKAGGTVAVLISASIGHATTVVARPGLQVRDLARRTTTNVPTTGRPARATLWRMSGDGTAGTRVTYLTDTWHLWHTLPGNAAFRSTRARLTLVLGHSRVTYRGTLRAMAPISRTTHRITVNVVSLEGYVRGVVPREMPASWRPSALRAQAIAARTYASFEAANPWDPRFNLCDTTSCQVYGGSSAEVSSTNEATGATAGLIRTFRGAPAFTQFSASSGGWTSSGGEPYLPAQPDPYDGWPGNGVHTWSTKVTSGRIERTWPAIGNLTSISIDERDGHGQWHGRVQSLTLHGSTGDRTLSGDAFRTALGLRSTWFDLSV